MTGGETDGPDYNGPFVVLASAGPCWIVSVDPPLPDGSGDRSQTFATKIAAWSYAQAIWTDHRLPLRDLSAGNTARSQFD